MVIVMSPDATADDVDAVVAAVESAGGEASVGRLSVAGGSGRTFIGVTGDLALIDALRIDEMRGVGRVRRVSTSYKLVSREHRTERSTVEVGGVTIGPGTFTLIAGPCAVESAAQTTEAAQIARSAGATMLRGGAFKPRTSPYAFQGLGEAGLKILADVRDRTGLPVVTEVLSVRDVELVASYADMLQIGTRSMQNFPLLQAVGAAGRPVLLKRGMMNTIEEWLMAAEYIARAGTLDIVLCERGIRTFEPATRNTLDIAAVPLAQHLSHLPVIVDPSHSGGRRDLVAPLSRAAVAAGADGVIIDVHPRPEQARCDGGQALTGPELLPLARQLDDLTTVLGRTTAAPRYRLAG
ncbi:3-deoxy-7-phosphoheptulonate synthase [Dactylosporangium maewongense]